MKVKMRSKKGFMVIVAVLLSFIMVTMSFSHVLGRPQNTKSDKAAIGYVDSQGELVTYNVDGVQIEEVTDPAQRDSIIERTQYDPDFQMLLNEVARYDAGDTGQIDIEIVQLQLYSADPMVVTATFDNGNLDRKMTGGQRDIVPIEMVSLSLRSINDNDIHISVAYGPNEDEKIVAGVVTNNNGEIGVDGLEHQVYYVHCVLIVRHYPVYWYLWWYDSHHHPNWFYGWYFWYWRYHFYYHYYWYPWYTWWWGGWYYWHYWGYWSTWWPYYYPYLR
ncbi:MAG: hypothetical protein JSV56_03680 [Methanomassiliicoccales archaeon]|nr:MAG: hypothetical protein JSV56_03680 [Methanomassiliicoccales archaeon]